MAPLIIFLEKLPFCLLFLLSQTLDFAHINKKGEELIYNLDDNFKPFLILKLLKN